MNENECQKNYVKRTPSLEVLFKYYYFKPYHHARLLVPPVHFLREVTFSDTVTYRGQPEKKSNQLKTNISVNSEFKERSKSGFVSKNCS